MGTNNHSNKESFAFYRKILSLCRRVWMPVILIGLCRTLLWMLIPIFAFSLFSPQAQPLDIDVLTRYGGMVLAALIVMILLDALSIQLLARSAYRFEGLLAGTLFATHLNEMKNMLALGERAGNPLDLLDQRRNFWLQAGPLTIVDLFLSPLFLLLGLILNPLLASILGGAVLLLILIMPCYRLALKEQKKAENLSRRHNAMSRSVGIFNETVVTMGLFTHLRHFWRCQREREFAAHMNASAICTILQTLVHIIILSAQLLLLTYGFWLFQNNQASFAEILALTLISFRMFYPFISLSAQARLWVQEKTTRKTLEKAAEIPLKGNYWHSDIKGEIKARQWSIIPKGELEPIFTIDSLDINAGKITLLYGASESGKSLLCRALAGTTDYQGSFTIDDHEEKQWDINVLGETIGYLPQNIDLFTGTIGENIRRFNSQYHDDHVIEAAKEAGAHQAILDLPRGYFYETSPGDIKMATGLRQKIALARALYRKPKILILDAPESHADKNQFEKLVTLAKKNTADGVAVIIASSDKNMIKISDYLILLKHNQVVAAGNRETIMLNITRKNIPDNKINVD